jgi:hypothetical protein
MGLRCEALGVASFCQVSSNEIGWNSKSEICLFCFENLCMDSAGFAPAAPTSLDQKSKAQKLAFVVQGWCSTTELRARVFTPLFSL